MGEPKPLASLTSGLLARKGGARPAMRRQPLGSGPAGTSANGYDDLGWNDMGYDVDPIQSGDQSPRVDIKTMLTGSMPAHNFEAEAAVSSSDHGADEDDSFAELSVFPGAAQADSDTPAEKPEIVKQQEVLMVRVASARSVAVETSAAEAEPLPLPPVAKSVRRSSSPRAPRVTKARDAGFRDKAAFTLRLDAERHLRLRLASAIYNRSAQHILIAVLDDYLSALPEIDAMASRLPASPSSRTATHNLLGDDQ